MALMDDPTFAANEQRYYAHMERFILANNRQPMGDALIELERTERWELIMGKPVAEVLPAPQRDMIEDAARKRGLRL